MLVASDIILEVTRAADPARSARALQKLVAAQSEFTGTLERQNVAAASPLTLSTGSIPGLAQLQYGAGSSKSSAGDPFAKLEAFFLQTVIQHMLPSGKQSVFGSGPGAEAWRSMMAEQISNTLASSGGIGVSTQLSAGSARQPSPSPPAGDAA